MRTVKGFVCAVHHQDGSIWLYGPSMVRPHPSDGVRWSLLQVNGFCFFPTRGSAQREAESLSLHHGDERARVVVGYAIAQIADSEGDIDEFPEKGSFFAVQICVHELAKGEMVLFGPSSAPGRGFDGREEARLNGLLPFSSRAQAEHVASFLKSNLKILVVYCKLLVVSCITPGWRNGRRTTLRW